MKPRWHSIFIISVTILLFAGTLPASEELVINGDFGQGLNRWEVKLQGKWTDNVAEPTITRVEKDPQTGRQTLCIDTSGLNPAGKITDDLRFWNRRFHQPDHALRYYILVTQKITGIEPNAWYLARFRIRSPGIAVDEGLELLLDLKPWTLQTSGPEKNVRPHWKMINAWEQRLFLPQSPIADGRRNEYVLLKQTYPSNNAVEIGFRIRSPWTGKIFIDSVSLTQVNPEKDLTKMEKLLAMRAAKPIRRVRKLHRETTLSENGKATAAILIPGAKPFRLLGEKIRNKVRELTGAKLPVVTKLEDVPKGQSIVAVGSMMKNELVARLHFNFYVKADAVTPGAGGYLLWSVCEPYGLAKRQNVIVVAGSDAGGQAAAVDAFCSLLEERAKDKTIVLPFLHAIFPKRTIPENERKVNREQYMFRFDRWPLAGFSMWFFPRWLATGDLEVAKLAREEILMIADYFLNNPYFQTAWDKYHPGFAWDAFEEAPVLSDADRLKISNFLQAYLHMRPQCASGWSRMFPRLMQNPTWNHTAKATSGAYTVGRYLQRYYPGHDGRFAYYLRVVRNEMTQQAKSFKPQENSGNYWFSTMRYCLAYYLGEWDKEFFESGNLRKMAEYFATTANNKGWQAGFGHSYYCYHGSQAAQYGGNEWGAPLAFWYYKDPRILWWLKHCFAGYKNLYHQDVEPVEWKELLGVRKTPLERSLYDKGGNLRFWVDAGQPHGDVAFDETFDKIAWRENWDPQGQYMLIEGMARGPHLTAAANQICKLSLLGEDLLIGSCAQNYVHPRAHDSVLTVKDAHIEDEAIRGKSRWFWGRYYPLKKQLPAYAAAEAIADLPRSGFTRTATRGVQGTDWHRNVFWLKGKYFAMIDEVIAKEPGTFYAESNFRTCPRARKGYPRVTARTWKLLEADRGVEQALADDAGTKLYILSDGRAKIVTEDNVKADDYVNTLLIHQVREGVKLAAREKVTFLNLFYGDRRDGRANYRLECIGPAEGLVFQGKKPIAYFGCAQSGKTRAILPIDAKMFLLTGDMLAVVEGTSAGTLFTSERAVSREVKVPAAAVGKLLKAFGDAAGRSSMPRRMSKSFATVLPGVSVRSAAARRP